MDRKPTSRVAIITPQSPLLLITLTTLCILLSVTDDVSSRAVVDDYDVEQHQPEIFLPPRNFNPHPYYGGYEADRPAGNTGPVLFPGDGEGTQQQQGEVHPVDLHPYAKVANKYRYKARGRFNVQDNRINPKIYNALDAYAKKVLKAPASSSLEDYIKPSFSNQKKPYKFSYKVLDHHTGDDFSHTQSQTPQATRGEYKVKLPDGRIQTVSYTADKNGYNAIVKYTEDTKARTTPPPTQQHSNNLVPDGVGYFAVTTTSRPIYYNDYGSESAYFGAKLTPPYVVDGLSGGGEQHGVFLDDVYEGEIYDSKQIIYKK